MCRGNSSSDLMVVAVVSSEVKKRSKRISLRLYSPVAPKKAELGSVVSAIFFR